MKHNETHTEEFTDEQLRTLLHKELPGHMPAPWFTRKVMNRLPERCPGWLAPVEMGIYVAGLIATIVFAAIHATGIYRTEIVTLADLLVGLSVVAIFTGLVYMIVSPFVKEKVMREGKTESKF